MTPEEIQGILSLVSYRDWTFHFDDALRYLQIRFTVPDPLGNAPAQQFGRRWPISRAATKSEIVQTALLAVLQAEEHEARENFRYRGKLIFGPHFNVDSLTLLCDQEFALDARHNGKGADGDCREALG